MNDAERAIDTIAAALAEARASVENGAAMELGGLEAAVAAAMRLAEAAPAAERATLVRALAALVAELDRLAAAVARQARAETQRRAAVAYSDAVQRTGAER